MTQEFLDNFFNEKFHEENKVVFWNLHETRLNRRIPERKNVISSQEKQVVDLKDVCIKKDPGYAPKKVKVYLSRRGDINHASKNIKRRKLKGKEVENVYEKKSEVEGMSNTL